MNAGEGGTKSNLEPEGQASLFCVWHPPSMNSYCLAFFGRIFDFLSFSDHLLEIFAVFKALFDRLVIVHVMGNRNHRNY